MTIDTFLFDVGKAITENGVNYELLEKIKNGRTVAAKFDSKELKFKTPNTVVVFSNEKPDVTDFLSFLMYELQNGLRMTLKKTKNIKLEDD